MDAGVAGVETDDGATTTAVFAVVLVVAGVALLWVTWATAHLGGRENVFVVLLVGLGATVAAVAAGIWRKRSWWATALGAAGARGADVRPGSADAERHRRRRQGPAPARRAPSRRRSASPIRR
ncbi:MAG: hypothetical protein R2690_12090 [Acidimicrobiales bacterium]